MLAITHHPDKGGRTEIMQKINAEYAFATAKLLKGENLSTEEMEKEIIFSEEYRKVIEAIANLENIQIEIVGFWIWVTGETILVKGKLKQAGLFYASKKRAWYFRSALFKGIRGGKKTLDEIRQKYGSEIIDPKKRKRIAE